MRGCGMSSMILSALRSIVFRWKFYTASALGLAFAMSVTLLVFLLIRYESSYDEFWNDADQIYRIHTTFQAPDSPELVTVLAPGPIHESFEAYFSDDLDATTRVFTTRPNLRVGESDFQATAARVDAGFIDVFQLKVISGSLNDVLSSPSVIGLSKSEAQRVFGGNPELGSQLTMSEFGQSKTMILGAIYEDIPDTSVLDLPVIMKIDRRELSVEPWVLEDWLSISLQYYVKLKDSRNDMKVFERLDAFANDQIPITSLGGDENVPISEFMRLSAKPLKDAYLTSEGQGEVKATGDKTLLLGLTLVNIAIILLAAFNYMTITAVQYAERSKEVAVRRISGASTTNIFAQFFLESFMIVMLSFGLSLIIAHLSIPFLSDLASRQIGVSLTDPSIWGAGLILIAMFGFVAIAYPVFVLTKQRPALVLKASAITSSGALKRFVDGLVIIQITVISAMIFATSVVMLQFNLLSKADIGYNPSQLLVLRDLPPTPFGTDSGDTLSGLLRGQPGILSMASSSDVPSNGNDSSTFINVDGRANSAPLRIGLQVVGYDFFETYSIPILAGRSYKRTITSDILPEAAALDNLSGNIVINLEASKLLGFENPDMALGSTLRMAVGGDETTTIFARLEVVGVIENARLQSARELPRPEIYPLQPSISSNLTLKYEGDSEVALSRASEAWRTFSSNEPLLSFYLSERISKEFSGERRLARMLSIFSFLALVIASTGLISFATYLGLRRSREVAIRKIFGARPKDIILLLLEPITRVAFLGNGLAVIIAGYFVWQWLQNFPDKISGVMFVILIVFTSVITLLIGWAVTFWIAAGVARKSPLHWIRH